MNALRPGTVAITDPLITSRLDPLQILKITVYSLLLINFYFYIIDDIEAASHTLRNGGSILQWTRSFATTIDLSAWFALLFLFELETYVLSDDIQDRPIVRRMVHGVRLVCYLSLMHSVYAFSIIYFDLSQAVIAPSVTDLCKLAGDEVSFVRNLKYTDLSAANCSTLSGDSQFYFVESTVVITDTSGLALEKKMALVDLLEVLAWLLILMTIEIVINLQDKSITKGTLIRSMKISKLVLYSSLWGMAAYWLAHEHYRFAWDEALWIVGFFAIEANVSKWKKEIEQGDESSSQSG